MSEMLVTCFTDLKGSTEMTERLGEEGMRPLRAQHLAVGELLAKGVGGNYRKSIGDAHMVTFSSLEPAFHFATQLQQYHASQPCTGPNPLEVRVSLYLGIVEPIEDDVFGPGVNRAARVEGVTPPGQVYINEDLVTAITGVWGEKKANRYFTSVGEVELRGIQGKHKLFSFDWSIYGRDNPKDGLSQLVYDHLQDAAITPSNLTVSDVANPASIIWPVVPRDLVNAIHRGQIEIIRLLALVGWKVQVLIADCGVKDGYSREYSEKFSTLLVKHMERRGIQNVMMRFMSDLYRPKSDCCHTIHEHFQKVITDLTFQDLMDINLKDYDKENEKLTIEKSAALDFLRPALTIAAILRISQELEGKSIVIVGYDERKQWTRAHDVPDSRSKIGVLFNPILIKKEGCQARQGKNWPHWDSLHALVEEMATTNLIQWTAQLHAFLPGFPAKELQIIGNSMSTELLKDAAQLEEKIGSEAIARYVYDSILSI